MKERVFSLDVLRAFAILSVVLCHATESYFSAKSAPNFTQECATLLGFTLFTIGRLGVPIFLFLTGYLLFTKHYDFEAGKRFYKRNLLGLFITIEIWVVIYAIFLKFFGKDMSLLIYIKDAIFIENVKLSHYWYIPMILGLYMIIPMLSNMLNSTDKRLFFLPLALGFFYIFMVPFIASVTGGGQQPYRAWRRIHLYANNRPFCLSRHI